MVATMAALAPISVVGMAAGAAAGATVHATGLTASAAAVGLTLGKFAWMCIGCDGSSDNAQVLNYDCWKAIVHDNSVTPSQGRLLKDIVTDHRVKDVICTDDPITGISEIVLVNLWDERFGIQFFQLPNGTVVGHAEKINYL